MAQVELLNPPQLSPPRGFSHVAVSGPWVWLGGQIGSDETGHVLHPGDIVEQFRQAIGNVVTALAAAGCSPQCAVKLTYYVTDVAAYRRHAHSIGEAYRAAFGKHYPAASLFEVSGLFDPDALVEIECVACREDG